MITADRAFVASHLPRRPDDAHKGTMGTLCAITGSFGCAGAAVLSGRAALKSGVGLHLQVLPEAIYPIYTASVPESVCIPVKGSSSGGVSRADVCDVLNAVSRSSAVLIGCGLGNTTDTAEALRCVVKNSSSPVIIDADGINALAEHIDILREPHSGIILTPHIKEFSRLTGISVPEILAHQQEAAEDFAREHPGVVVVLKSHRTVITNGSDTYLNTAGNSGMAKGGSGDVLAGIVASLAAQGLDTLSAAVSGVHIHALAGDSAAERLGKTAMLPSDMIDCLSEVYRSFES